MKFDISEKWSKNAADMEKGHNVAAGVPSFANRVKIESGKNLSDSRATLSVVMESPPVYIVAGPTFWKVYDLTNPNIPIRLVTVAGASPLTNLQRAVQSLLTDEDVVVEKVEEIPMDETTKQLAKNLFESLRRAESRAPPAA